MRDAQRILVVDDEIGPREGLRMILEEKYQVMTAVNGPDALQVIHRTPPDLVFLDVKMPGMSGVEVLKAIKQVDSGIETIMMTAYASLETVREALAYGASEYLIKPFGENEVEGAVEKALARRAERTGARREVWTLLEQLRTLAHASTTAADQQDLLQSVSVVLEQVKRLLGATAAMLHVIEEPSRRLTCKVYLGGPARQRSEFDGEAWAAPLRQTLNGRLPLILSQGQTDPRPRGMARVLNTLGAFFPMFVGDEEVGVLSFFYEAPREFRGEWTEIGQTVAALMALSILSREIKETKSYLETLINGAGVAIITVNRENLVTAWNASAERIFQYRDREMLQQNIGMLFPRESYAQWRDEVLRTGGVKQVETRLKQRDGHPIDVGLTFSPLRGSRDEVVGFSAIMRDVTAEKQLRTRLLQSEKLSALGEMVAGIAHNFNNVLATILGRAQLLANDPANVEAIQKGMAIIEKAAEDGATMVQRIQKFAKESTEVGFNPTDLNQVVQEAVEATRFLWNEQAQREGRRVEVVLDLGTLPPVHGRAAELREVLTNMILNAVEAMPGGGRITLRTRPGGGMVCLEVSDTGSGMTDEVKRRIFDPFFTTKGAKGTGLGLRVSYALIKGHNGEIEVQSELGRGTTFSITLPVGP